jgi:enterochelin esterase family protein
MGRLIPAGTGFEFYSGVKDALPAFWAAVAAGHGPIVEPLAGDADNVLVTFVWKETFETHNVRLDRPPVSDFYLTHLAGIDVWYRTMKVLKRTLIPYSFEPNYAGDAEATSIPDPLNPRLYPDDASRADSYARSVLRLSEAPDESWAMRTLESRDVV